MGKIKGGARNGGIVATLADGTERTRMEERTEHFASFPQLNPNPVLELDGAGKIVYCNPAAQRIIESLGAGTMHCDAFLPPDIDLILKDLAVKKDISLYREVVVSDRIFGQTVQLVPQFDVIRLYAFDITERRRSEQAKLEIERRFHSLFENMAEGVALHELVEDAGGSAVNYRLVDINPAYEQILGLKREDIVGKMATEAYGVAEPPYLEEFKNVVSSGMAQRIETYFAPMARYFDISIAPWGERGFATIFTDTTERKQAEEALRESEEQFRTLADAIPQLCWMADADGWIFWFNQRWYEYTGTAPEQMEGWGWQTVHDQGLLPAVIERWQASIASGTPFDMVFPLRGADGVFRPFLTRVLPVCDRDGKVVRWFGTNTDITEQRHTEQILREGNQRLDLLADTAGRLLASDSPQRVVDSLCQKVMTLLNCHVFFNFLVDEQEGRLHLNACAGIPEEEKQKIEWLDFGVAVCGCAARDACRIVAEDIPNSADPRTELVRSYGVWAYACHPLMAQGKVLGTLSFGTRTRSCFSNDDLALMKAVADQVALAMERKRTEEELRRSKEAAEAAARAKSQFLANMSHELRTPMSGVLGMLDLALGGPLEEGQRECIRTACASARSLLRILNDILDLAKIEAGKVSLKEKPFDLQACIIGATDLLAPEAHRKGLQLIRAVAENLPDIVIGDEVRLRQVLTNLIGNAVKFTEQGKVEVRVTADGATGHGRREITFAITDTGIGIPSGKQHLLFRQFSQVDSSDTRKYGGTGLGLAISRELVERMGGTIAFDSLEGHGSTFSFTIPLGEYRAEETTGATCRPAFGKELQAETERSLHLLVAEDDAVTRKVLGLMLQRSNFETDFAADGWQAVEMWEKGDYDLVLMDVQMPRLDGFAATRAIRERERERGGHTPIVAMTAHALKEDEQRCLDAGMDAHTPKPIDFKLCVRVIRDLLGQNRRPA